MRPVHPHPVWIGHAADARAFREIFDRGVRAVVQLAAEETTPPAPRDLVFLRVPLVDGGGNDPALLDFAIGSVAALVRAGIPTLVCCGAGMSRSPAVAAAALAVATPSGLDEALDLVTAGRSGDLSPPLWADVRAAVERAAVGVRG